MLTSFRKNKKIRQTNTLRMLSTLDHKNLFLCETFIELINKFSTAEETKSSSPSQDTPTIYFYVRHLLSWLINSLLLKKLKAHHHHNTHLPYHLILPMWNPVHSPVTLFPRIFLLLFSCVSWCTPYSCFPLPHDIFHCAQISVIQFVTHVEPWIPDYIWDVTPCSLVMSLTIFHRSLLPRSAWQGEEAGSSKSL
jgi:hypothetical protein